MKTIVMRKAAVLFNGIKFPFAVIDRSYEWAKNEKGMLLAVFLLSKDADPEGYIFPSDIDAAENISDEADSISDSEKVVESYMQMMKNRAVAEQISFQTIVLHDPSGELLSDTLQDCKNIFVTKDVEEVSTGTIESIDLKEWLGNFPGTIEIIPA